MDNEILKLLPKKAFDLISFTETLKIGTKLTKSLVDNQAYQKAYANRLNNWRLDDVQIVDKIPDNTRPLTSQHDGERILKIYFLQFFDTETIGHLDFRAVHFASGDKLLWRPSTLHYQFSEQFRLGIIKLYTGFYLDQLENFKEGLILLGMIPREQYEKMTEDKKTEVINIFLEHFGEGKTGTVQFSLKKLQDSFNNIFTYFLKENIPLNPEFAVLGAMLVTLYMTLEKIPHSLNVHDAFMDVFKTNPK